MKRILFSTLALCVCVSFSTVGPAFAQADADDEGAEIEEILVTGSRIPRDSFNVSTPLVSIDSAAITDAGLGSNTSAV